MKKSVESFLLRMLMLAAILGAMCFVGAYAEGHFCVQMLLTPAFAALAYAAQQTEKNLWRAKDAAPVLRPAPSDPDPLRAA